MILSVLAFFRDRDKRYVLGAVAVALLLGPIVLGLWVLVTGGALAGGG